MFFTDKQMKFINELLPDMQNKEYDDYTVDEMCLITETVADKLTLECFGEDNEPIPEKKTQMNMCYSILDKIGEK